MPRSRWDLWQNSQKFCAEQLSGVFQRLFQTSIDTCTIPDIWKLSTVIPIPKKDNPKLPNDFRPTALTSFVTKTLEKIIKFLILAVTECNLDPLQFAYRSGRGVDDAKVFILNTLYRHLEGPQTNARILFSDFSFAFNTMQPHILANKLVSHFSLDNHLVLWIIDFLTNRLQRVFVNGCFSELSLTCTGSPLLYILYTDDCRSNHLNRFLVKFADDSALVSQLSLLTGATTLI